jgi:hypothetical protein
MARRVKSITRKKRIRQRGGSQPGSNIYVFYHIYCNNKTEDVVKDQALRIIFSGLYKQVNAIKCYLAGEHESITKIKTLLNNIGKKFEITKEGPNDKSYERFTLLDIPNHIKPDDKFLYIHSKGVSEVGHYTGKTPKYDNIFWWRTWMEYFLMTHYKDCLEALNTHDLVGVNYSSSDAKVGPHFSGNFWWSTGKYYLSLEKTIGPHYNDPEKYIFSGKPNYKDIDANRMPENIGLYDMTFYTSKYID